MSKLDVHLAKARAYREDANRVEDRGSKVELWFLSAYHFVEACAAGVPTEIDLTASPNPSAPGEPVSASGHLSRTDTNRGLPNQPIILEMSLDRSKWTEAAQSATDVNGDYTAIVRFQGPGTAFLRARFPGKGGFVPSTSRVAPGLHIQQHKRIPTALRKYPALFGERTSQVIEAFQFLDNDARARLVYGASGTRADFERARQCFDSIVAICETTLK